MNPPKKIMNKSKILPVCILILSVVGAGSAQRKTNSRGQQNIWSWKYKNPNFKSGAVQLLNVGGKIVLVKSSSDSNNLQEVVALDSALGKPFWTYKADKDYIRKGYLFAETVVLDSGKKLSVLDLKTGKRKWQADFEDEIKQIISTGETLYVSADENGVTAFEMATGKKKFTFRPCFNVEDNAVINERYIVLPCKTAGLFVADATDGKLLWQFNYFTRSFPQIFLQDDKVFSVSNNYPIFVTTGNFVRSGTGGGIKSFEAATGKEIWTQAPLNGELIEKAKIFQNKLGISFTNGKIRFLDSNSGKPVMDLPSFYKSASSTSESYTSYNENAVGDFSFDQTDLIAVYKKGFVYSYNLLQNKQIREYKTRGPYPELIGRIGTNQIIKDAGELIILNLISGKKISSIEGEVSDLKIDESENLALAANENEIYFFPNKKIKAAFARQRKIKIPLKAGKKYAGTGGVGTASGTGRPVNEVFSGVVLAENKAYLVKGNSVTNRKILYEIDPNSNSPKVLAENRSRNSGYSYSINDPIITNGTAFFPTAGKTVSAIDVASGKEVWKFESENEISSVIGSNDDKLFVYDFGLNLYGVDKKTGSVVWKRGAEMRSSGNMPPQIKTGGGFLFFPTKNGLKKVNAANGEVSENYVNEDLLTFTVAAGKVLIFDREFNLSAYDIKTDRLLWKKFIGRDVSRFYGETGKIVFVKTASDELSALDTETGESIWERNFYVYGNPQIQKDVFISKDTYNLLFFDSQSGVRKLKLPVEYSYNFENITNDGTIIFRKDSRIIFFDANRNKILQQVEIK